VRRNEKESKLLPKEWRNREGERVRKGKIERGRRQ